MLLPLECWMVDVAFYLKLVLSKKIFEQHHNCSYGCVTDSTDSCWLPSILEVYLEWRRKV